MNPYHPFFHKIKSVDIFMSNEKPQWHVHHSTFGGCTITAFGA